MPRKAMIIAFLLISIGLLFSMPWEIELNLDSDGGSTNVIIGVDPDATDGYDLDIDTPFPFSPPDGVYAFSNLSDPSYPTIDRLSEDYRADDSEEQEWIINFNRGEGNQSVSWDAFPSGVGTFHIGFAYPTLDVTEWTNMDSVSGALMFDVSKQIHIHFAPTTSTDNPPMITNLYPYDGATRVPLDSPIDIDVMDPDGDLIRSSIVLTVNGTDITSDADFTAITGGFNIEYLPTGNWSDGERYECNIFAMDESELTLDRDFDFTASSGGSIAEWELALMPYTIAGSETLRTELYLGLDEEASEGFDLGKDVVFPIPPMVFHSFFSIDDSEHPDITMLSTDVRQSGMTNEWIIELGEEGSGPCGIYWASSAIPDEYEAEIGVNYPGVPPTSWTDMTETNHLAVMPAQLIHIRITDGETIPDTTAPTLLSVSPADGEDDVPLDVNLIITIQDDMTGVDESSIELVVNGTDVTADAEIEVTALITSVYYNPEDGFEESEEINWQISCCDNADEPNCNEFTGSFRTEVEILPLWSDTILIHTDPIDDDATVMRLIFGADSNATDDYDIEYDRQAPPPPPGFETYGFFVIDDPVLGHLFADIRDAEDPMVLWEGQITNVDSSTAAYSLSWNGTSIPDEGTFMIGFGEYGLTPEEWFDMRDISELEFYTLGSFFINYNRNPVHTVNGTVNLSDEPASLAGSIVEIMEMPMYSSETDEDGNYEIVDLPEGEWTFVVSHDGYVPDTIEHTISSDTTINFTLEPYVETYSLFGNIQLDPTAALDSTEISVDGAPSVMTDDDGNYIVHGLETGEYELLITREGYSSVHTTIIILDEDLEYNDTLYEAGANVVIYVGLDDPGDVLEGSSVTLSTETDETDEDGYVVFEDLEAGDYFVQISRTYYATITDTLAISDDDSFYYELEKLTATVSGTVTSSLGGPMAGLSVTVAGEIAVTDGDGNYSIENVLYGDRAISASTTGYTTYNNVITVDEPEVTHDFVMEYSSTEFNSPEDFRIVNGLHDRIGLAWNAPDGEVAPSGYNVYQYRIVGSDEIIAELPNWCTHYIIRESIGGFYYVSAKYGENESDGTEMLAGYPGDDETAPDLLIVDFDDGAELAEDGAEDEATWMMETILPRYHLISDITDQNESIEDYDLLQYNVIWIITGIDDASDEYISDNDLSRLRSLIGGGGSIYWEGADIGYDYGAGTGIRRLFFNHFGANYEEDGRSRSAGNVQELTGTAAFFEEGQIELEYGYQTTPDTRVDEFTTTTGTAIMTSQDDPAPIESNIRMVANFSEDYNSRTVLSSVYLGGMHDTEWRTHHRWMVFAWIWNFLGYPDPQLTDIQETVPSKPVSMALINAYPNPFNSTVNLEFEVPENEHVKVELLDIEGKLIKNIYEGNCISYSIRLEADDLESGVYLVKLSYSGGVTSQRISLIK